MENPLRFPLARRTSHRRLKLLLVAASISCRMQAQEAARLNLFYSHALGNRFAIVHEVLMA
jgi:hypothetical protein